jgi:hypothetical protein
MLQTRKIKHAKAAGDSGFAVCAENVFHHAFLAKSIHKQHMSLAYSTWAYSRIMPNSWLALKKGITVTKRLPRYEAPLRSLVSLSSDDKRQGPMVVGNALLLTTTSNLISLPWGYLLPTQGK